MALQKQSVSINFSQGIDQRDDPNQIPIGQFGVLNNSVFNTTTGLTKRNGYGKITSLPSGYDADFLTTFNDNLTAISGTSLSALAEGAASWVNQGSYTPLSLTTLPLVRSNTNQTYADVAVSPNGFICTVYVDVNNSTPAYKYTLADSTTGQTLIAPTVLTSTFGTANGAPRVFALGNYFLIVFSVSNGSVSHLQYIALSTVSIGTVTAAVDVTTNYTPSSTGSFDGVVAGQNLYLAWNSASSGGVKGLYFTSNLGMSSTKELSTSVATIVTLTADTTQSTPIIWMASYDSASSTGSVVAANQTLVTQFTAVSWITSTVVNSLMVIASDLKASIYYEVANKYGYDSAIPTNFIQTKTVSQTGSIGSAVTLVRSVGLASKGFIIEGVSYFLAAYQSPFQPTYFLINGSGLVVSKIAYENGGGYLTQGLPSAYVSGTSVSIPYLYKDLIASVNKDTNVPAGTQVAGIYSQTGVNLVTFSLASSDLTSSEIGNSLNLTGGFLWMYDGTKPVEQNFFLFPDSVELTPATTGGVMTAQEYFYQVTYEWTDSQGNIHRSAPSIPVSVTTTGSTSQVTINVPTLRLTYKTASPVKIVIYRWSAAQETYYQVTSLTAPLLNDVTSDSVSFVDKLADSSILGNSIIYTNGNVVEDVGAPSFLSVAVFDTRLVGIDAEDPNSLWYSKQVIENTPVEMSDLFTIYVSPNAGAQGATGPMKCLAPMDDKLIIFKKNAIYYINGTGPDNTGANSQFSQPTFITSTVGCSNQNSIVMTPNGLMFQSDKGIWLLGRDLSTRYVGKAVQNYNTDLVNSSVAIPGANHVRFCLESGVTLIYDYYQLDQTGTGQWGTFTGVPSVSSCLYQDLHTFINSGGDVYQETVGSYLDGSSPVLMNFTTGWINAGGIQGYQRAYYFYMLAQYYTPHKVSFSIAYDYDPAIVQIYNILPDNYSKPWGGDETWGSGSVWGGPSQVEQWRVNLDRQQCQTFQVTFNEYADQSFGVPVGQGLSLSTLDLVVGIKKQWPGNIAAKNKV